MFKGGLVAGLSVEGVRKGGFLIELAEGGSGGGVVSGLWKSAPRRRMRMCLFGLVRMSQWPVRERNCPKCPGARAAMMIQPIVRHGEMLCRPALLSKETVE